jgi:H/ACA ribonucleoprotein complex subunit 3
MGHLFEVAGHAEESVVEVYVNGRRIRLSPTDAIGKGGEADVYALPSGLALKVFKSPAHPDFQGLPDEQDAARLRIDMHQKKLPELLTLARTLPARVVAPQALATDRAARRILGYTMRHLAGAEVLLRYSDRGYRSVGIGQETVRRIFLDLHATVACIHEAGVIVGDFNDLNVLVAGTEAYLIDTDSFQLSDYPCPVFTARFVDPLLCDPDQNYLVLRRPYTAASDWYAFAVMLMQSLLFVGPYGGVYRPARSSQTVPQEARPLRRITVFCPQVRYPKPAVPYARLPDDLLHYFHEVFEKDRRGEFPKHFLEELRWTTCTVCGSEHARSLCPECALAAPAAIKEVVQVRGKVVARRVFHTDGVIVFATALNGELRWLYHENNRFKRDDGSVVFDGALDPRLRIRLHGAATLLGRDGQVVTLTPGEQPARLAVDTCGGEPAFDCNGKGIFWIDQGRLLRHGRCGPECIGEVLAGQTRFWVGPLFGFGFYRAGDLSVAFVFDAARNGINDTVKLPAWRGQWLDSCCCFAGDRCWFFLARNDGCRTIHHCLVVRPDGSVEASAQAEPGDGSWLATLDGKCAAGDFLLAATDGGIVRVAADQGRVQVAAQFPDTEPFVDSDCRLFPVREGLAVISRQDIRLLRIT